MSPILSTVAMVRSYKPHGVWPRYMFALFSLALATPYAEAAKAVSEDTLVKEFQAPPNSARPRIWWHWLNGNITQDGIAKDLQWMHRIGLGGVQNFDASVSTPQVVEKRLVYMSPEWKDTFRFAVKTADELNLEFGIAASAGWSETGGPWVAPQDGMKKLVWSESTLAAGQRFDKALPLPPAITGPFQNIPQINRPDRVVMNPVPQFYNDVAVLAYRIENTATSVASSVASLNVTANGSKIDSISLFDNDPSTGIALPVNTPTGPGTIEIEYTKAQTIRSVEIYIANLPANALSGPLMPQLEASDDGRAWRKIAEFQLSASTPATSSFTPVKAKKFRLVFTRGKRPDYSSFAPAPGADLSVMAAPSGAPAPAPKLVNFRLSNESRVNAFELKAGFSIADNYYALGEFADSNEKGTDPKDVLDLSEYLTADGHLNWTAPEGRWRVLRLGYSLTGKTNAPASQEATGLEVDKYDASAVQRYLETYLGMYRDVVGAELMGKRGLRALVTDSIEAGPANWTPQLIQQFESLRGYDPTPWLPALTGEIVGSRAQSDAFLFDFRRTLADLIAKEHYGTIARVAHAQDMIVYGESLEGGREHAALGDDLDMRRYADIPMAAMWTYKSTPAPYLIADMRGAASVAHFYGRTKVAAESLTSTLSPWAHAPADLQPMIDVEFLHGINQPVLHASTHQPLEKAPGMAMMFGQFFTRHETWSEMARPWIDYIARSSYLLQQGSNVADVAYLYGEEPPLGIIAHNTDLTDVPQRYAYDFISANALLNGLRVNELSVNGLSVNGNELISTGGARYKALYLGGTTQYMSLPVLRKLAALAEAGATIVGSAPKSSPSLGDDRDEFTQLTKRLWGDDHSAELGKGRVIASADIEAALNDMGIAPDFSYIAAHSNSNAQVQFVHRQISDGDIYYIANRADAQTIEARFRVTGKAPEIWRADSGVIEPVSYRIDDKETIVPLQMNSRESFFVVFRKPAAKSSFTIAKPVIEKIAEIDGAWDVAFQSNRGVPEKVQLPKLTSLSEQNEPGVKYFSGVSTYTKTFDLPKGIKAGQPLVLDLGGIGDIAEVRVNGKLVSTVWKAPYRLDIGKFTRNGKNTLDIRVANLWVNRLIGDRQPNAQPISFTTIKTYNPKAPLRPSGLIGPVTLWAQSIN